MKCKNCGHLIWKEINNKHLLQERTETKIIYWHNLGVKGVSKECLCGCVNPEPVKECEQK